MFTLPTKHKNPSIFFKSFNGRNKAFLNLDLRMLENFMGAEEFRIGIKRFLERFKYGNARCLS
jgi:hypothetical protein